MVELLKQGLEKTLSQTRHLCGNIVQDPSGGHCFVKKRDSTVQFVAKWLDQVEHEGIYPSFADLENADFVSKALGDITDFSVSPMTYAEKSAASLNTLPKAAAFQATFIRGGLVFMMHHHHGGMMGWDGPANFTNWPKTAPPSGTRQRFLHGILLARTFLPSPRRNIQRSNKWTGLHRRKSTQTTGKHSGSSSIYPRARSNSRQILTQRDDFLN